MSSKISFISFYLLTNHCSIFTEKKFPHFQFSLMADSRSMSSKNLCIINIFLMQGKIEGIAVAHCSPYHLGNHGENLKDCYIQDFQNTVKQK